MNRCGLRWATRHAQDRAPGLGPDGRDVIVGSVLSGSIMLTISLSLEDSDAETLLPQVATLLATALDRLP